MERKVLDDALIRLTSMKKKKLMERKVLDDTLIRLTSALLKASFISVIKRTNDKLNPSSHCMMP